MEKQQLQQIFNTFLAGYDTEIKDSIWAKQSQQFKDFWNNKILSGEKGELNDAEIDQIIKILDKNGRGNTRESEAVARAMIAQGAWRRMFNGIKGRKEFSSLLNEIFLEDSADKKADSINKLYKLNDERHINNLTGPSGNAVCAMLAAFNPNLNLSMISLKDREGLSTFLGIDKEIDFSSDNIGKKIALSNEKIIKYFDDIGIHHSARTISVFFYSPEFKSFWKFEKTEEAEPTTKPFSVPSEEAGDPGLFYMESQLEDFLVEN